MERQTTPYEGSPLNTAGVQNYDTVKALQKSLKALGLITALNACGSGTPVAEHQPAAPTPSADNAPVEPQIYCGPTMSVPSGTPCLTDTQCGFPAGACISSKCSERQSLGKSCGDDDDECAEGLKCDEEKHQCVTVEPKVWTFDTGSGKPGQTLSPTVMSYQWTIESDASAPSAPNVITGIESVSRDVFLVYPDLANVRLSTRCKFKDSQLDQICGLTLRGHGPGGYWNSWIEGGRYLVSASSLNQTVSLEARGNQTSPEIIGKPAPIEAQKETWHTLAVEAQCNSFKIYWDEKLVLETKDSTFLMPGGMGIAANQTTTSFDDVTVEPLR